MHNDSVRSAELVTGRTFRVKLGSGPICWTRRSLLGSLESRMVVDLLLYERWL
jgi:hypothetical protein